MSEKSSHLIERTSPKGEKFVGRCSLCGKPNLTTKDANEDCSSGVSQGSVLLMALNRESRRSNETG